MFNATLQSVSFEPRARVKKKRYVGHQRMIHGIVVMGRIRGGRGPLQGYLALKKPPHPITIHPAYAYGLMVVQGGVAVSCE